MRKFQGGLDGQDLTVGIVAARFNWPITSRLLQGALAALRENGVSSSNIVVVHVPGAFEVPMAAREIADWEGCDAVICLGAVIRGETDHYEYVAGEVARGIANAAADARKPCIFGILTTDTIEQADARSGGADGKFVKKPMGQSKPGLAGAPAGGEQGNAGYSAGLAAIETANLMRDIASS